MVLAIGCTEHLCCRLPAIRVVLQCIKNGRAKSPRVSHVAARPMRTTPEGFRRKPDGVQVPLGPSSSPSHQQRDPPFRGCPGCVQYARILVRAAPFTSRPASKGRAGAEEAQATLACSPQSVRQTGQFTAPRSSHRAMQSLWNACPQRRRPAPPRTLR